MNKIEKLESDLLKSPLFNLSAGSKELFHSNFLYWLGMAHRDVFQKVMSILCQIDNPWPKDWTLHREYHHLDLCVTYMKATGKVSRSKQHLGEPVMEENVFIVLENKVKSLPDLVQLRRYEKLFAGRNQGCTYVVLSLVKDFIGKKELVDNTIWQLHHYDELARIIMDETAKDPSMTDEHKAVISDYCNFVANLTQLADDWKIAESEPFLQEVPGLSRLRINDIYEKVRYAQIAKLLTDKLTKSLGEVDAKDNKRVLLGMSDYDVITRKSDDASEMLGFYGCPDASPKDQVYISTNLFHAIGLVEAKVQVSDKCCLVIQVQGNRYCHGVECENARTVASLYKTFVNFKGCGLPKHSISSKNLCKYGTRYVYKAQEITDQDTVADIVDAMASDVLSMMSSKGLGSV